MAGGITALYVVWLKGVSPLSRFITEAENAVPVLRDVTDKLNDPQIVAVIVAMAKQFQADSGSSLRDVVNRLEDAATAAAQTADLLRVTVEGNRQLADADRQQIARLLVMLDRIQMQGINAAAAARGVAADLQDSHERATAAADPELPGVAADAAVIHPDPIV